MKLYATVTSERASKGQGGKAIRLDLYGENRNEPVYCIGWTDWGLIVSENKTGRKLFEIETKGNKQKGNYDPYALDGAADMQ